MIAIIPRYIQLITTTLFSLTLLLPLTSQPYTLLNYQHDQSIYYANIAWWVLFDSTPALPTNANRVPVLQTTVGTSTTHSLSLTEAARDSLATDPHLSLLLLLEASRLEPEFSLNEQSLFHHALRQVEVERWATNQNIIDAFHQAATEQDLADPWVLLDQAELSLGWLVVHRDERYDGLPINQMTALTQAEQEAVERALSQQVGLKEIEQSQHTFYQTDNTETVSFSTDDAYLQIMDAEGETSNWDLAQTTQSELFIAGTALSTNRRLFNPKRLSHRFHLDSSSSDLLVSPSQRWLLVTTADGTLSLYWLNMDYLLGLACRQVKRNLTPEEWATYLGDEEPYRETCSPLTPWIEIGSPVSDELLDQPTELDQFRPAETVSLLPTPKPLPPGFLRHLPELAEVPFQPPEDQRVVLGANASMQQKRTALAWNSYGGLISELAPRLSIDVGLATSIVTLQSGGRSFGEDGRLVIRFENQLFHRRWGQYNPGQFQQHFSFSPNAPWQGHLWRPSADSEWQPFHANQLAEWEVLTLARSFDNEAALSSTSMGGPQILGSNYAQLGYGSVQEMFDHFADPTQGERNQILGLFDFIKHQGDGKQYLVALQQQDYYWFAVLYNGRGQATYYANTLAQLHGIFNELK
ncbi:N-acetylmuramidase domain-containing protein [Anaerolineales bacterium HSG6]|nr:N-acetylmuramidase domain-containing protein [Anaerolineales bacterium HSG6]